MSPNHHMFVAVTIHFEFKGEELCLPLDFVEVAALHTGKELANVFAEMLKEFRIKRKVSSPLCQHAISYQTHLFCTFLQALSVTCNDVSNNNMMVDALGEELPGFNRPCVCMRCFLHILNLVAKCLIWQFNACVDKENVGPNEAKHELAEALQGHYNCVMTGLDGEAGGDDDGEDDEVNTMKKMNEEEHTVFEAGVHPIKLVLAKVSCCSSSQPIM